MQKKNAVLHIVRQIEGNHKERFYINVVQVTTNLIIKMKSLLIIMTH